MNGDDDAKRSGKRLPDQPAKTQRTKGPVSFPSTVSLASLCEEGATASSNLDLLASCSSVQGSEDCDCEGHQPESERRLKRPRQAPWAAEPANQRRPPFDHSNSESIPPAVCSRRGLRQATELIPRSASRRKQPGLGSPSTAAPRRSSLETCAQTK